jgi:beta-lactamase class D
MKQTEVLLLYYSDSDRKEILPTDKVEILGLILEKELPFKAHVVNKLSKVIIVALALQTTK